jgi:hypothetical protein
VTIIRFPVMGYAESSLLCAAEVCEDPRPGDPVDDSDDDVAAVVRAWRRGSSKALVVERAEVEPVIRGLTALANGEDAAAEMEARRPLAKRDPQVIRAARSACAGLTGLALRVAASAAPPR